MPKTKLNYHTMLKDSAEEVGLQVGGGALSVSVFQNLKT